MIFFPLFLLVLCGLFCRFGLPYCNIKSLKSGAHVLNRRPFSLAPNVPCPTVHHVSSNFVIPITHLFYHEPPQTHPPPHPHLNHESPINSPSILTNHTPLISSPYQHLTLCMNERSQPYTFPVVCDICFFCYPNMVSHFTPLWWGNMA